MEKPNQLITRKQNGKVIRIKASNDEHIYSVKAKPFNRSEMRKVDMALRKHSIMQVGDFGDFKYGNYYKGYE